MKKAVSVVAFGLGVTVGAAASLMYAPHSGKITRNKVRNKYEETLEDLNEKIVDAQNLAKNLKQKIS